MKILLSGFDPFADLAINSSQAIVQEIERRWNHGNAVHLTTEILPTVYGVAEVRIRSLIREIRPDVILCLGVADSRSEISLERVALNYDNEPAPDNAGDVRLGQQIIADGPSSYMSTLPLEDIRSALERDGIPVTFSESAGAYVCNHVFYSALHEVERLDLDAKCGFIHVPAIGNQRQGLPLEMMVSAIESSLDVVVSRCTRAV